MPGHIAAKNVEDLAKSYIEPEVLPEAGEN